MAAKKRIDPVSTHADGFRPFDALINPDPERHYVIANPNDELSGVSFYESLGYQVERKSKDGVRLAVGKTVAEGDVLTVLGGYLMSCPKQLKAERDGRSQELASVLENRIVKQSSGEDKLRGQYGVHGQWGARIDVDPNANGRPYEEHGA